MNSYTRRRIDYTNTLLQLAIDHDLIVTIDWNSTMSYSMFFTKQIEINDRFVYWTYNELYNSTQKSTKQRFNKNSEFEMDDLNFTLTHLNRALKKELRSNDITFS